MIEKIKIALLNRSKNKRMLEEVTKAVTDNAARAQNKDIPK